MRHGGLEPLLEKLVDKCRITGGVQLPRRLLCAYQDSARAQGVDCQRGGMWTRSAGAPLMIIERMQQKLIMLICWCEAQGSGNGKAEESGHLVVDHSLAYRVELIHGQDVQQGRAGDKPLISAAAGQEPSERLNTSVDDHGVVRQWQRSADDRIMIKMDPTLRKREARREPPLVSTRAGTEIDDLQGAVATTGVGQIVDQLGEEAAEGGGAGGGVGGGPCGKPICVDRWVPGRSR